MLRFLGYSWDFEVSTANELVELIIKHFGGRVCVFDQTVKEIESALKKASRELNSKKSIFDYELRHFAQSNKWNSFDFDTASETVRGVIKKAGFRIESTIDWDSDDFIKHNLDWQSLTNFIQHRHLGWNEQAIKNDITSLIQINILRKGDYTEKFGGKKNLPIFITTNTALVEDIRQYISENNDSDKGVARWNIHCLPAISDNMLMCRLWIPVSQSATSIPVLNLTRYAYSSQKQSDEIWDRMLATSHDIIKKKHTYNLVDLDQQRRAKLEEISIRNAGGELNNITAEIVGISFDELIAIETSNDKSEKTTLKEKIDLQRIEIEKQKQHIINGKVEYYKHKKPIRCFWRLWLAQTFNIIAIIVYTVTSFFVKQLHLNSLPQIITFMIIIVVLISIEVVKKKSADGKVAQVILKRAVNVAWNRYVIFIEKTLSGVENDHLTEIISACKQQLPFINKYPTEWLQ
jgi:hypothetical protein